jgi:alpha-ketoglutaric semialdehyde dehydrogenase
MPITGEMLIGAKAVRGKGGAVFAHNPVSRAQLEPTFNGSTEAYVDAACTLADAAFNPYRAATLEARATFLETIAENILGLGEELIERVMAESGLPRPRLEGERGRTVGQLRLFAALVREGRYLSPVLDAAQPERKPAAKPDLRARMIPLGPVAVFGASNFPLAFSVAGGDTASALAAGCPVVAKSHPSHLGTSELVGRTIQAAVAACGLPEGTFSLLLDDDSHAAAEALVLHPAIQAVGFTGSRRVGRKLVALAASREVPIPVFAEMSSINPVFLLPSALEQRAEAIAQGFVDSFTLGVGQFCTKPGIVLGIASVGLKRFRDAAIGALEAKPAATMLNAEIRGAYRHGAERWTNDPGVHELARGGAAATGTCLAQPMLFATSGHYFYHYPNLLEEVFGPASLLIECVDEAELLAAANHLNGQLTATLQLADEDHPLAAKLLPILERKAGRILCNGFPTGVEVAHAMVHGGPAPATSDSRSTSVGGMAMERFLRPVCYQDLPAALMPEAIADANPLQLTRLMDGKLTVANG